MKELQVEALKPKIQKALGAKMDKAADVAVESMFATWQSMIAKARAKEDFQNKLGALYRESK